MPLLAGPPVEFAARRFYDAGVSESVPFRTALAQGATHILVLRSRRDPLTWTDGRAPARSLRLITRTTMRRESAALRATFLGRDARLAAADRQLAAYEQASPLPEDPAAADSAPAVFSIRPAAGSPQVSRLATDGKLLRAAFAAGEAATRAAFHGCDLSPLHITCTSPHDHGDFRVSADYQPSVIMELHQGMHRVHLHRRVRSAFACSTVLMLRAVLADG